MDKYIMAIPACPHCVQMKHREKNQRIGASENCKSLRGIWQSRVTRCSAQVYILFAWACEPLQVCTDTKRIMYCTAHVTVLRISEHSESYPNW